jgi:hypothetical protein
MSMQAQRGARSSAGGTVVACETNLARIHPPQLDGPPVDLLFNPFLQSPAML